MSSMSLFYGFSLSASGAVVASALSGTFQTPVKYRWRLMNTDEYCQYCTRLGEGLSILLHSVIYERPDVYTLKPSTYNWLGATKSHGCIRFTTRDAKWIYDNAPIGTRVYVFD